MTEVFKGSTSHSFYFVLVDSTTGLPKTGVVYTDVTGSYVRSRAARSAIPMVTLASASASFSSGGFILVDDTNQPGVYRLDVPDAAFATGVEEVVVTVKATGCKTESRGFTLVDWNKQTDIAATIWSYTTRLLTAVVNTLIPLQQKANWTLYRGNSYSSTARDMTFTIATGATWPTDLSTWTWTLYSARLSNNTATGADTITGTVSVVTATGSSRALRVSITDENAALLALGQYRWALRGTSGGEIWDVVKGVITVED